MLKILKISGNSMSPRFKDGDFVVVGAASLFLSHLKAGDVIVFRHGGYGTLVKKIERVAEGGELIVTGTQADSLDSRRLGPISAEKVLGKVIWHIRK